MKLLIKTILAGLGLLVLIGTSPLQAQKFSAVVGVSGFRIDEATSGNTNINYEGSTSFLVNARYFTDSKLAFRLGVGLDNLNYTVGDSIMTNYDARRRDLKGVFGVEKHFQLGIFDFYPGLFIPITVVGDDIIEQNFENIKNDDIRASLGFIAGANAKLFKIILVGVEFDATFDDFQAGFREGVNDLSFAPIRGVNFNTAFTIGVTF